MTEIGAFLPAESATPMFATAPVLAALSVVQFIVMPVVVQQQVPVVVTV